MRPIILSVIILLFLYIHKSNANVSDTIHVSHYTIKIDTINIAGQTIRASCELNIISKQNGITQIPLSLLTLTIDSVISNSSTLTYTYNDPSLRINTPSVLNTGDSILLTVYYHGTPKKDASGWGGFYFSNPYAFNLGVGFDADPHVYGRVWFPCIDEFTDRAKYDFFITTSSSSKAFCNGALIGQVNNPNGTITWHWAIDKPIPTYLACIAVGPYYTLKRTSHGIPVEWACAITDTNKVLGTFQHLDTIVGNYIDAYGPYPWNKIGYSLVPFGSGAMEHASAITIGSGFINGSLTYETLWAHELSHMWWGDNVTCDKEEEMWLNEGWATFNEAFAIQAVSGVTAYKNWIRTNHRNVLQFAHINDGGYWPVNNVPHNVTYGNTAYNKGGDMVHTLRNYLGDSLFKAGCKYYMNNRAYGNANSANLRDDMTAGSGVNMTNFFNDWIFTPGFGHFSIDSVVHINSGIDHYYIYTRQRSKGNAGHIYTMPVEITFSGGAMDTTLTVVIDSTTNVFHIALVGNYTWFAIDRNEKISDAISDYERVITATGTQTMPETNVSLNVSNAGAGTNTVRIEHNWVVPDPFKGLNPGIRLSDYHYWKVDGIFSNGFLSKATFTYDGTSSLSTGYIDNTLITTIEDSLVILYRAGTWDDWHPVSGYTINFVTSHTDKKGTITVDTLKRGEYVLGVRDFTVGLTDMLPTVMRDFRVYPNPTADLCHINFHLPSPNGLIIITDITGKKVFSTEVFSHQESIDWDTYKMTSGIYFVQLIVGNKILNEEKIIVEKR